jgi:hypothetical protein
MNKKEDTKPFVVAFVVLLVAIIARYLIYKLRPGTFSIITFHVVNTKDIVALGGFALLIKTDKLRYYRVNLGISMVLLVAYLTSFLLNIKTKDLGDYIGAGLVFFFLSLLIQYSIRKIRHHIGNHWNLTNGSTTDRD